MIRGTGEIVISKQLSHKTLHNLHMIDTSMGCAPGGAVANGVSAAIVGDFGRQSSDRLWSARGNSERFTNLGDGRWVLGAGVKE
jgi:hypothetical protein